MRVLSPLFRFLPGRPLDSAIELEGIVLRNARAAQKSTRPAGQVTVEDQYVIVGGIRVPKGGTGS